MSILASYNSILEKPAFADAVFPQVEINIHSGSYDQSQHLTFYPPSTSAFVGQTIEFGNGDIVTHEIVSGSPSSGSDGRFDSGPLKPGQYFSYSVTANDVGVINFYDKTYPWMTGAVTVQRSQGGYKVIHNVGGDAGDGKTSFDVQYLSIENIISSSTDLQDKTINFILSGQTSQTSNLTLELPNGLIQPPIMGVQLDGMLSKNFAVTYNHGIYVLTIPITPQTHQVSIIGTSILSGSSPQTATIISSSTSSSTTSQQQIKLSNGGIIYVGFSATPANPSPRSLANLHVLFINKSTKDLQQHVDYRISVMEGSNKICDSSVMHSTNGSINFPCIFQDATTYQIVAEVDGILFQPIQAQTATFSFSIGGIQNPMQAPPIITVSTDKTSYNYGDTVMISGNIQNAIFGTTLASTITGPDNEIVDKGSMGVNLDGSFTSQIPITGHLWNRTGTYHDFLQYGETDGTTLSFIVNYKPYLITQPNSTIVEMTRQIISTTPVDFGSDNASSIAFKCQAFLAIKAWVDAYEYCNKALQLDPQNTDAQRGKEYAYNNMTQIVSSIVQADNTLTTNPSDEIALSSKAAALIGLGKYSDSLSYENKVLQIDPVDSEVWQNKAIALFHMGRYADALQAINNATLYPINYPLKISILYSNGKYDEAILYVDEFYKQLGGNMQQSEDLANFEKGLIYEKASKHDSANQYYQLALSDGALSAVDLNVLKARMYYNLLMDFNKTLEYADKVSPDSPYYHEASEMKVISSHYLNSRANQSQSVSEIQTNLATNTTMQTSVNAATQIPDWIRNNAKWWSEGTVGDDDFTQGIQYLIKQKIIHISPQTQTSSATEIPSWVKTTAGWWSNRQISDDDFVKGIEYLVRIGIIKS